MLLLNSYPHMMNPCNILKAKQLKRQSCACLQRTWKQTWSKTSQMRGRKKQGFFHCVHPLLCLWGTHPSQQGCLQGSDQGNSVHRKSTAFHGRWLERISSLCFELKCSRVSPLSYREHVQPLWAQTSSLMQLTGQKGWVQPGCRGAEMELLYKWPTNIRFGWRHFKTAAQECKKEISKRVSALSNNTLHMQKYFLPTFLKLHWARTLLVFFSFTTLSGTHGLKKKDTGAKFWKNGFLATSWSHETLSI